MKRAAVVGFGFMGMTHALNILKNADLQLVAIVDKDPETIEKNLFSQSGNISTGNISPALLKDINKYSSFSECLRNEELDTVHICVHTGLHYEMTKMALMNDKHVMLEKPFTLDILQAQELIDLAKQKNKILMIAHVVRFMPPYQKLKEWIDSKEFGELKFLSLTRFSGIPGWGQWTDKQVTDTSGGALFDLNIHDIDFASYVLGSPSEIKASHLPGGLSNQDYISAMWSYKDKNVHVKIEGGNTFHVNFPFQAGYMAQFEKASIRYSSSNGNIIQIANDTSLREVPAGDAGDGYFNEIDYFAQCIKNNTQPTECMPASSLESIKLCYNHL
jgi:predicted dehydrogenase